MSVSAILFIDEKGQTLISRTYRDDIRKPSIDAFRNKYILGKQAPEPVVIIDQSSFCYIKESGVYIAAVTRANANSTLIFQFLYKLLDVLKAYFGKLDKSTVEENFVVLYELLDETMDNGFPQVTAVNILTTFIKSAEAKKQEGTTQLKNNMQITGQITGSVDWRQSNKYKYRKNEVYLDVLESINYMQATNESALQQDVAGKIQMKSFLSGMPECKFGLNEKLSLEKEAASRGKKTRSATRQDVAVDDITFHRCVKLGQFDVDRTISFIPPDGEFELMRYRVTRNIRIPFKVNAIVREHGRSKVEYDIKVRSNFDVQLKAQNVVMRIPVPTNHAKSTIQVSYGKAKYNPSKNAIIWKMKKFPGHDSHTLHAEVGLLTASSSNTWSRPPITMDFQIHQFAASLLNVRFLKVVERSGYDTIKWVRYVTKAGNFQIRI